MVTDAIRKIEQEQLKSEGRPALAIGDSVKVHINIREGGKERIQVFAGTVIAKNGGGVRESFTVRRISHGVGMEKVFPLHSPAIAKIEHVRSAHVRRAKLYYLRDRTGKKARLRAKARQPKTKSGA